jgi:haloalkane dehalogenase
VTAHERTDDTHFDSLADWPYEPHYHSWEDLRVHYVDEGPSDGPVMLLTHGMPTWGYLYRTMIPGLVDAGYRCIAPDHLGFGRSDKPTDRDWYSIARHAEVLASLVTALDLRAVTLVCQDWGGPIGLAQAATMPDRFSRLIVMNTWLHHPGFEYTPAIRNWIAAWQGGGLFDRTSPNVALVPLLSAGVADRGAIIGAIVSGDEPDFTGAAATMYAGFAAPFRGVTDQALNGARMFPLSIPVTDAHRESAAMQTALYDALLRWPKPVHFVWGGSDDVFTEDWGRTWADRMSATFDVIPDAHHFLQNTHGPRIVEIILERIAEEGR